MSGIVRNQLISRAPVREHTLTDNDKVSVPRMTVGDLVDASDWMPSLLLLWIGLVGAPLVLTALQAIEELPLIVAIGWVWLTFLGSSALSGPGAWVRTGSLATSVLLSGGWILLWVADGLYPIAGLPLFGAWTDTSWLMLGGVFLAGKSAAICIRPPVPSARMARVAVVSLVAGATLIVPWWWLPTSNNTQYVLFFTAGLGAVPQLMCSAF